MKESQTSFRKLFALALILASASLSTTVAVSKSTVEVEIDQGTMSATASQTPPSTFPRLNGMNGEEAKRILEKEYPSLSVHLVPEDSMVTMDFREDRVRLFVGPDGKVARIPVLG
jgi:Potato inhibitor I family